MRVLAKFSMVGVTPFKVSSHGKETTGCVVNLRAVKGEPFGSATPSGSISMTIHNPSAADFFLGAPIESVFYVTFENEPH